mgnify:CR=1 FL=1
MTNKIEFDENLWFNHKGCEGKHYLIGNPHTFHGRIYAWCPKKGIGFCVSISEIERMSDYSKYWIQGYLNGNQPEPPTDSSGDVNFESSEYKKWMKSIQLFTLTGYWTDQKRNCVKCGTELLNSYSNEICEKC